MIEKLLAILVIARATVTACETALRVDGQCDALDLTAPDLELVSERVRHMASIERMHIDLQS
ncbi:hypothetical protein [Methylosinus sp. H3A]|uniref:hypothetical protein n=1 Tax=Methylosinus sp. H3A TaxID=2785786 RepID=UPI0028A2A259|nr:hypothetical protein [Methylosinus sp. H3A]